jgi:hypothetical protein
MAGTHRRLMASFSRMRAEDDWQRWCARFDQTEKGVLRLFHDRAIWRTILTMLDDNPEVHRGSFGEHWLGWCYTTTQLIAVRRECDHDDSSAGILRSLKALASTPRMATRSWYIQQINQRERGDLDPEQSDAGFNMFAAASAPFISAALVQQDIDSLSAVVTKVNTFTTKNLAHRDDITSRAPAPAVTWGELDSAIDAVGNMHKKYYRLRHPGESLGALTPLISPGWIQMFGTAWMRPEFTMPDDLSFEPHTCPD